MQLQSLSLSDFLDQIEPLLLEQEVEHNMLLGQCAALRRSQKPQPNALALYASAEQPLCTLLQVGSGMTHIAGWQQNAEAVRLFADYYQQKQIETTSIFGARFFVEAFAAHYHRPVLHTAPILLHRLETLREQPLPSGSMQLALASDAEELADCAFAFEADIQLAQRRTREQLLSLMQTMIAQQRLVKWVDADETVSMAAIMRSTPLAASIGLVYTPPALRGKGYATACVQELTARVLRSGMRYCGLFTDQNNPISNKIYQKIGYVPMLEFCEVGFG